MPAVPSGTPFGVYVHVPFCAVRCGYCDFNTYTATELGGGGSQAAYAGHAARARWPTRRRCWARRGRSWTRSSSAAVRRPCCPRPTWSRSWASIRDRFGLAAGAEVTTEANPDSVTPESLAELREGGFTRVSFGMQSAVSHVLRVLERTHDPARVAQAVGWAREAGFEQVSLDLIYGTPGESLADWRSSSRRRWPAGPTTSRRTP